MRLSLIIAKDKTCISVFSNEKTLNVKVIYKYLRWRDKWLQLLMLDINIERECNYFSILKLSSDINYDNLTLKKSDHRENTLDEHPVIFHKDK